MTARSGTSAQMTGFRARRPVSAGCVESQGGSLSAGAQDHPGPGAGTRGRRSMADDAEVVHGGRHNPVSVDGYVEQGVHL